MGQDMAVADEPFLEVRGLGVQHRPTGRWIVRGVNLSVAPGGSLGLVGESGSGKSITCLAMTGLQPASMDVSGTVLIGGVNTVSLAERQLNEVRARTARVVFQDPWATLNPALRVGAQLVESVRLARPVSKAQARDVAVEMLVRVGIAEPELRLRSYPRQLSGGILQRVVIAMALVAQPKLLICDEPTTALDATTEIQVLELLRGLSREYGFSLILTTHDLGIAAEYTDRLAVLYQGRVVEYGNTIDCLRTPHHPYTLALTAALPGASRVAPREDLPALVSGAGLATSGAGCSFAPRCAYVHDHCLAAAPPLALVEGSADRSAACWLPEIPAVAGSITTRSGEQ
jgi:peptide/nickel transport system ATP-binding protein